MLRQYRCGNTNVVKAPRVSDNLVHVSCRYAQLINFGGIDLNQPYFIACFFEDAEPYGPEFINSQQHQACANAERPEQQEGLHLSLQINRPKMI